MAVVIGLFVATLCVIARVRRLPLRCAAPCVRSPAASFSFSGLQREEEERFKKIDAKRGGRGFV